MQFLFYYTWNIQQAKCNVGLDASRWYTQSKSSRPKISQCFLEDVFTLCNWMHALSRDPGSTRTAHCRSFSWQWPLCCACSCPLHCVVVRPWEKQIFVTIWRKVEALQRFSLWAQPGGSDVNRLQHQRVPSALKPRPKLLPDSLQLCFLSVWAQSTVSVCAQTKLLFSLYNTADFTDQQFVRITQERGHLARRPPLLPQVRFVLCHVSETWMIQLWVRW